MKAIYKREMGAYFNTMQGYVYLALYVCFTAVFFCVSCVANGYNNYSVYVLSNFYYMMFAFALMIPILTMRMFAEEKKHKTDQLLLTSPVPIWKIVLGKYLAGVTVFTIGLAMTVLFPVIIVFNGGFQTGIYEMGYSSFFLCGITYMAIGTLVSSLVAEPILALIITAVTILLDLFSQVWVGLLPSGVVPTFIFFGLIIVGVAVMFYIDTRKWQVSAIVAVAGAAIVTVLYFLFKEWFVYGLKNTMSWLSIEHRYESFLNGIFDIASMVYLVTLTGVLLFMTGQVIARRRWK